MTREQLKKHWKVIKAYKNGDEIQVYVQGNWRNIKYPNFYEGKKYKVKPFEPKNGDRILVKISGTEIWKERIFIKMEGNKYLSITGSDKNIIETFNNGLNISKWEYAKPLNK